MGEFFSNPETWVGIGTLVFFALLIWKKVPALIGKALDARAAGIAKELEDARLLREEAEALLRQYQQKQSEAEKEAAAIVTEAHAEAQRYAVEARQQIDAQIERRAKMAQEKIAQAEAQALAEVRALAADAAVAAAEKLIAERLTDQRSADLVRQALKEIPAKLN
jgi:F-type H+-transporting ATPase subunit b